jgi:D-alanine--poly(phosphoribitol) ligase subunit 1
MVLQRIQSAALAHPHRIAHISDDRRLTYAELWGRASALAAQLQHQHADQDGPVAIRGHKEPEMLIGFLGTVLAGRAYIPLDASLPEARVERIIATANPVAVLPVADIAMRTDDWQKAPAPATLAVKEDDPFYILFTSGSTGDPKGVIITHGCLEAFVAWMQGELQFVSGTETFLNQAPFSFDLSVMDLYLSLTTGGTLFSLTKHDIASPREMYARLRESGVTTWVSTPSFAGLCMVEKTFDATMLPALKRFWFCGETLPHKTAAVLLQRFPNAEVWNTYGPTEATVATTSIKVDAAVLAAFDPLPIGRTRPGSIVEARAPDGTRCQDGERGEIIILGPNVSPGYLGRADLTAKAFFVENGQRGYRTGDRGYAQGEQLFFEGRMDFQVKVRGHRIELGDVESHLREVAGVTDAVVLPVERRGAVESLAAFLVMRERAHDDDFAQAQAIRTQLATRVPDYMLPRRIDFLAAFPLTPNGKADRRALAALLDA